MSAGERAVERLKQEAARQGGSAEVTVQGERTRLRIRARQVEGVGAAVEEIEAHTGRPLRPGEAKQWARRFSSRARYLLEPVDVIEADEEDAIVRSVPPSQGTTGPEYYEAHVRGREGRSSLRRYAYDRHSRRRQPRPLNLTHDQLKRLVDDLDQSAPA